MNSNFDKLKKIFTEKFGVADDEISPSSDLTGDFNLSNLEINDLISQVTDEFALKIPDDEETGSIKTVTDLINMIETYSEEL